ncbi:MAG: hypothetical protein AABY86_02640 [Bdellovibrionota bacterium]
MESSEELSHEHEFPYKGPAFLLWFWFLWSISGYFILVSEGESSYFYEIIYLLSAIMAAMGLNNRMYGVNHRISFYKEYVILPKLIHLWHWKEEKIFYKDIQDIRLAPLISVEGKSEIEEIELKTHETTYPIFYRKLHEQAMQKILKLLGEKTGLKCTLMTVEEVGMVQNTGRPAPWQWRVAGLAFFVSLWAVLSISLAEQYHLIIGPSSIFIFPFVIAGAGAFIIHRKIGKVEGPSKQWQKYFLLIYITFYGGISLAFSLIYLNGALDSSNLTVSTITVEKEVFFDEHKKGYCVELKVPSSLGKEGRAIASSGESSVDMIACRPEFEKAEKGAQIKLSVRQGAFLGPWISDMTVVPLKNVP